MSPKSGFPSSRMLRVLTRRMPSRGSEPSGHRQACLQPGTCILLHSKEVGRRWSLLCWSTEIVCMEALSVADPLRLGYLAIPNSGKLLFDLFSDRLPLKNRANEEVWNQSIGFSEPDILFQLLPSSFGFYPNTLRPIRWLTASGLHVQNSNMQRLLLLLFFFLCN